MTHCIDEGTLRAYLDHELPAVELSAAAAHLAACGTCRQQLATLRGQAEQVHTLLGEPALPPDPRLALRRVQPTRAQSAQDRTVAYHHEVSQHMERKPPMQQGKQARSSWYRRIAATAAVVVLLAGLLALPPVRALAVQMLSIFRVEQVMFVPVDMAQIERLEDLDFDGSTLFMSEPEAVEDPGEPYEVASVAEAEQAVGYDLQEPDTFPGLVNDQTVKVVNQGVFEFQVNVETSRELLALLEIDDVTIPDELGDGPIEVAMPAAASLRYTGEDYELHLMQGRSPDVNLPAEVDLQQLGKATLRLLGLSEEQAETMSQQIDWSTTLIFPFPEGIDNISQVDIDGEPGLLVYTDGLERHYEESQEGERMRDHSRVETTEVSEPHWKLYWQRGDRFYLLVGTGTVDQQEMLTAAESMP